MFSHTSRRASCLVFLPVALMLAASAAFAQIAQPDNRVEQTAGRPTSTVTAAATAERVRITATASIVQMHVEVYAASGEKLFDQEIRGGNVFDWHLQDGQAQRLAPGDYVCVVTAKSVSGKLTQKIGAVSIGEKSVSVRSGSSRSAPQAQTIGPVEENSSWMVAGNDEPQTTTVIAHDGADGQMIRGRGALSFRIGNFFSGIDAEQMRLSEEGNLGIGTSNPRAKLDVAGTIRAERFLIAKPKPVGAAKTGTNTLATDTMDFQPLIAGTGSQDRIAKWTDSGGTLGDSVMTESAGNIGIGTPTATQALEIANGRILASGSQTISGPGGILEIGTTVTNNHNQASGIRMRNLFSGNANLQQALDVAPTFAPSASIALARGFISAAFFAPKSGVTITDAYGGDAVNLYNDTGGAVTNGTAFAINSPVAFGALKPINQFGLHINNQGIAGTKVTYGLFVDAQSGSISNYSAIFAGGNVGIGTTTPVSALHVKGSSPVRILGDPTTLSGTEYVDFMARSSQFASDLGGMRIQRQSSTGNIDTLFLAAPNGNSATEMMRITGSGNVGIGMTNPTAKLHVQTSGAAGLEVDTSGDGVGVYGLSDNGRAVVGTSANGYGLAGYTANGTGVFGDNGNSNTTGYAGYFNGRVNVSGNLTANNLPGVTFSQCSKVLGPHGSAACDKLDPGQSNDFFDKITVNVPAPGFLFITASIDLTHDDGTHGEGYAQFNLFQCDNEPCGGGVYLIRAGGDHALPSKSLGDQPVTTISFSWVLSVPTPGPVTLKTNGTNDNANDAVYSFYHNLTAIYLPK